MLVIAWFVYTVSQKVAPLPKKTFCDILTSVTENKTFFIAQTYYYVYTNFVLFV